MYGISDSLIETLNPLNWRNKSKSISFLSILEQGPIIIYFITDLFDSKHKSINDTIMLLLLLKVTLFKVYSP